MIQEKTMVSGLERGDMMIDTPAVSCYDNASMVLNAHRHHHHHSAYVSAEGWNS
jgi:hypothetical protein